VKSAKAKCLSAAQRFVLSDRAYICVIVIDNCVRELRSVYNSMHGNACKHQHVQNNRDPILRENVFR